MEDSGTTWRLGHRPALDGVRGIAILLVLMEHSGVPVITASGVVGVTLFFVLSGFLIASLLVEEWDRTGRIDLREFYVRRARRLGPVLGAMIVACTAIGLAAGSRWFFEPHEVLFVVFYVGNWVNASGGELGAFSGTWSLAVEEQFYMLWPVVALLVLRRGSVRRLMGVALALMTLSLVVRVGLWANGATPQEVYFRTDTTAAALLAGCALACWLHKRRTPRLAAPWATMAVACLLIVSVSEWPNKAYWTPTLAAAVSVVLVLAAATSAPRWLGARWLRWFGLRSYAMYLFHIPLTRVLRDQTELTWPVKLVLTVTWAALAAELSWRFLESRFRSPHVSDGAARKVEVQVSA